MTTPLKVYGTLPPPKLRRLSIRLPGKGLMEFVAEAINPMKAPDPVIPARAKEGLLTDWDLVKKYAEKMEGYYIVHWVYEAGLTEMPSAPDDPRSQEEQNYIYDMDCTLSQQPLTMHPRIAEFLCTYGGTMMMGELMFPPQDPTGTSPRSGYDQKGNYFGNINPFYGVDSYLAPMADLQRTFMRGGNSIPVDGLDALGYIDEPPEFPFTTKMPQDGKSGNWLKSEADASQHGQDLVITESWRSGGFGGWKKVIYTNPNGTMKKAIWAGGDASASTAGGVIA